ncbi:EmrA/EmrK family multidrug efflux transporter periplasmic adaptor subunit [Sphingomonas oleivorans]|uniref:EmrA/EmrK family multidrug efflux transporter periplasmic adaptor subunit n=1 Tax=Sphingomonas oleivorans TaxID=1735121 RepID=A0A2T5FY61_9SPHN|nr:HlyD family efflux transporter periplasmic adaptor subunit [Sphingomonas oleivorans]PTQ11452.1 EmrA/EmrK family multidrug efflux transporter periplasmic adaptor subunit [Sphingomonas oleivorans]
MADQPEPHIAQDARANRPPAAPDNRATPRNAQRKKLLGGLAVVVLLLGALFWLYQHFIGANHVSTDNAYVGADTAQVTPLVAGPVATVRVANTQRVRRGDILVTIDDSDARIAVARAEAELMTAERRFSQTRATSGALQAQVAARQADIARARAQLIEAEADYDKARIDLDRRQRLARSGAVSGDELTSATNAFAAARAKLIVAQSAVTQAQSTRSSAEGELNANEALVRGTTLATNPEVAAARARLDQARLDLARTVIRAPIDGVIAQRQVQVGQRVAAGTPIMSVVPLDSMYVDANFKEGQLAKVRAGQPVELISDLYGGDVTYHGHVVGFAGGTGSAFAIIPAQNATGNWIKVVQRLPVRISLDPRELKAHPLRVGLSMEAEIDVSRR